MFSKTKLDVNLLTLNSTRKTIICCFNKFTIKIFFCFVVNGSEIQDGHYVQ